MPSCAHSCKPIDHRDAKNPVVDDASPVVVLRVNVLQALGYVVEGANSGAAAVDTLRKERFDMMVVDYKMPGVTSDELRGTEKMLGELARETR